MEHFMDASTMIWIRMASSPVVGLTLTDDAVTPKARNCALLAMGASALKQKVVAITPNGKDYYTGLPVTNGKDTVLLAAMRWGIGRQYWQQTGEWLYSLLGPWEVRAIGEISENSRAWRWRRSAENVLEQVFDGKDLVPCGRFYTWLTVPIFLALK